MNLAEHLPKEHKSLNFSRQKEWAIINIRSFIKTSINTGALVGKFGVGKREENSQSSLSLINSFSKYSFIGYLPWARHCARYCGNTDVLDKVPQESVSSLAFSERKRKRKRPKME